MRKSLTLFLFLSLLVPFRSAQAQYCNANMVASTPDSQLTDNGNGTVTNTKTGLMWKKCLEGVTGNNCDSGSAGGFTWQTALQQPGVVNNSGGFAGHTDWRLPNVKELSSIVEEQCCEPSINLTKFPNTPASVVWSGSPSAGNSDFAWYVEFNDGSTGYYYRDGHYGYSQVRLVRGGL